MIKLLAWLTLGVSLVFVGLAMTALFGWDSLGEETAGMVAWFGAIPLAVVALLLAGAILVVSSFQSESSES
jgi:hypothetical protein